MKILRRSLFHLSRPLFRWILRRLGPPDDPWERVPYRPPLERFGEGLQGDFPSYLAGPSAVAMQSIDSIQEWLLDCVYQSNEEQFGNSHWQRVHEFEERRAGNCADHALWTWRKLGEMGIEATLVTGWRVPLERPFTRHAWVTFRDATGEYLFETVATSKEDMVRPFAAARDEYRPEYGVDGTGRRFAYTGALLAIRENEGIDPLPPDTVAPTA